MRNKKENEMDITITDESGKLRSTEDIKEALVAINVTMVEDFLILPPRLGVHMGTIRDALMELQILRRLIDEMRKRKGA